MSQTELQLIVQPPPVLRATVIPPPEFKTIIEEKVSILILQPPTEIQSILQPPVEIRSTLVIGQGPSGPPGLGEEMKYSKRVDFVGSTVIYKGEATPGSLIDSSNWRIRKITIINEDIQEEWAEGTANFDKMWSSRESYNYM